MAVVSSPLPHPNVNQASEKAERLPSVDVLRGGIMALMALDHVRDYFTNYPFVWTDPDNTTVAHFFTRWVTHFCAPAFFLLAGMGAYLSFSRGKPVHELSRFLLIRGGFLILLEITILHFAWYFSFNYEDGPWFGVLAALGISMIVLAGLVYLPRTLIAAFALILIVGHNYFDLFDEAPEALGVPSPLWTLLHVRSWDEVEIGSWKFPFYISYPLIPWIGVMPLGYVLGPILKLDGPTHRRCLLLLGISMIVAFAILRGVIGYGNARLFVLQDTEVKTVLAFLRTKKYPPSLQYLLMTLGPILVSLAALDQVRGPIAKCFMNVGRVPLFFYVAHLYVIHALAVVVGTIQGFHPLELCVPYTQLPEKYGFGLPVVYLVWIAVLVLLYPFCAWFCELKRRGGGAWLSYL